MLAHLNHPYTLHNMIEHLGEGASHHSKQHCSVIVYFGGVLRVQISAPLRSDSIRVPGNFTHEKKIPPREASLRIGPFFCRSCSFGQRCVHSVRISHTNFSLDPHRYLHEVMLPVLLPFSCHNTFCVRFLLI